MRIPFSFVLFYFIFGVYCHGQQKAIDSLDVIANDSAKGGRMRIEAMIRLSNLYAEVDKSLARTYSESAVELSNSLKDAGWQSMSYISLASAYADSISLSYALIDTASHYLKQVTIPSLRARSLFAMTSIKLAFQEHEADITGLLFEALSAAKESEDNDLIIAVYNGLANHYLMQQQDIEEAKKYAELAQGLINDATNIEYKIVNGIRFGSIYRRQYAPKQDNPELLALSLGFVNI
jgi:hypothetical protein